METEEKKIKITIEAPGYEPEQLKGDVLMGVMMECGDQNIVGNAHAFISSGVDMDPWNLGSCYVESAVNVMDHGSGFSDNRKENLEGILKMLAGISTVAQAIRTDMSQEVMRLEKQEEPEDE